MIVKSLLKNLIKCLFNLSISQQKNMKLVDDGETCCHCEPLPTTTTLATTTTPMATKTSCPLECVVDITCEDEVSFFKIMILNFRRIIMFLTFTIQLYSLSKTTMYNF